MADIEIKSFKFPGLNDTYVFPEVGDVATEDVVPISKGGTEATTAEEALLNLGGMPKCVEVTTAGTDLNDYITDGFYHFVSAYTPVNIPAGVNGWLMVIKGNDDSVIKQIWFRQGTVNSNDHGTYIRTSTGSTSGWSDWHQVLTNKGGTITGTLYINNTTDGSSLSDKNAALIIGDRSGEHIVIDTNEIIPKATGTTGGTLVLGDSGATVQMGGKFMLRSNYSYGTTLPDAGTAGRIFFKKVT